MVEMHFCESGNLDQSRVFMLRTIFTRIRYGLSRVKNRSTFFFTFLTEICMDVMTLPNGQILIMVWEVVDPLPPNHLPNQKFPVRNPS